MREVLPEYKNIQIAASYSKSDGKDKLLALGVDSALDRTSPDYLDNLKKLNSGKGPDVIFEMLANMNLPKDLVRSPSSLYTHELGCAESQGRGHYHRRSRSSHHQSPCNDGEERQRKGTHVYKPNCNVCFTLTHNLVPTARGSTETVL